MHHGTKCFACSAALILALLSLSCAPASLPDDSNRTTGVVDTPVTTTTSTGSSQTSRSNEGTQPPASKGGIDFDDTGPLVAEPNPEAICSSYDANLCGEIRPLRKMRNRYPIILAHGMGGFKEFATLDYFYQIPEYLRGQGYAVYVSIVDPFNSTTVRGQQLATFVDKVLGCTCAGKVNLIGHSQGGLDARFVVSSLGYGDRVATVTTIATPHRGTKVADIALGLIPGISDDLIDTLAWIAGNLYTEPLQSPDYRASMQLFSQDGIAAFNAANPDDPRVAYFSWAGIAGLSADGHKECAGAEHPTPDYRTPITAVLLPTWTALGGLSGVANDGLVAVESARWGRFMGCLPADHLQEVGHLLGATYKFDWKSFFKTIAQQLEADGN
ncbi:MAG: triacylglycerol lipase [Myxococcales bacterium]|nr:triacylglycerol lipase [Myxococcales bacterium]